jgi:hypothetical protein
VTRPARAARAAVALFAAQAAATATAVLGHAPGGPRTVLGALGQDAAVALLFALVARFLPVRVAGALLALLVAYVAGNAAMVAAIGTPLSLVMLEGADAAMGDSIVRCLRPDSVGAAVLVAAAAVAAWRWPAVRGGPAPAGGTPARTRAAWAAAGALALLLLATGSVDAPSHRAAVWHLVRTSLPRLPGPAAAAADWRREEPAAVEPGVDRLRGAAAGRSVVLVVLESAAARHLGPWAERAPEHAEPMPFLATLAAQSLTVRTTWAVYPESIKGLTALLRSWAPAPDATAAQHAHLRAPALPALLGEDGSATALFHPGHFRFLGMADVLQGMGFAVQRDAEQLGAPTGSSFGVAEAAAVTAALGWVASLPPRAPFCVCYLPVAGHHPYDSPAGGPFATDSVLGCYRNALHHADRSLQALWQGLCALRQPEELLLCVVGDHGQAFGEHAGNFGHTFALYEENLRVPLLCHVPGVTDRAERPPVVERVASHLDVVPTMLDLLGLPACAGHQGTSLLRPGRRLALAFTDWGDLLVAVRDERFKLVHEVLGGSTRLFDLVADPAETRDVGPTQPDRLTGWRDLARGWVAACRGPVASAAGAAAR